MSNYFINEVNFYFLLNFREFQKQNNKNSIHIPQHPFQTYSRVHAQVHEICHVEQHRLIVNTLVIRDILMRYLFSTSVTEYLT